MSIAADFNIDPNNRIVKHYSGATVYTINDLYSYIQDYFDEITNMTTTVPMTAQTPTEYTLANGWFIPEETYQYLNHGAVKTVGWDTALFADGIMITVLASSGYVNCISSDIGLVVTDGTHTGVLLDYNNTLRKWWIRKTSTVALVGAITITSGTGAGTISTNVSGESVYSNVYTLGAIDPLITNTLYVEQVNTELTNNQITQYWPSGHIDIIVKVKEANTLINSGLIRIYIREYTDLYSHFAIDLSAGGRNPVPLGTASDSNNQTASGTVATWSDVTITFGAITRDLGNGAGLQPYDVEIDCGIRTSLTQVYELLKLVTSRASGYTLNTVPGQFYRSANNAYDENTTAPFGAFAGGQFFGARGVYLTNVPVADVNNYKLIDANNVSRVPPYLAAGTLICNTNLTGDVAAKVVMFFASVPSGNYGTINAVIVNDAISVPISTLVNGTAILNWTFAYDTNTQGGRTAGTDAAVTIIAIGKTTGKLVKLNYTITRSTGQNITLVSDLELNYAN